MALAGKHLAVSVTMVPIGPASGFKMREGAQSDRVLVVVSGMVA